MAEQRGADGDEGTNLILSIYLLEELAGLIEVSFADVISKCMNLVSWFPSTSV
jgi:hypothetical protein